MSTENIIVIGCDAGNKLIKTANNITLAGIQKLPTKPAVMPPDPMDLLLINGEYYCISNKRVSYERDKSINENHLYLTLIAIAKEMQARHMSPTSKIVLATGLPPGHMASAKLMETYRKDELSVMVGKIWIIDENKDTVKIKESIQGKLCIIFSNHKVSYYNNIFYVSSTLYEQGETVEEAQQKLSKEMSVAIRKVANSIEPDEIICSMLETKTKTIANNYDEFFNKLQYVDMTPDDYCRYSEEPLMKEEEKLVQPQEELLDTEPKEDENDKIQKRIVLYKKLVDILVTIAGILIIMALLALTVLR